jgi:hypothetical protein
MSARPDDLAIRKRLLLAKSGLLRAQLQAEISALRSRSRLALPLAGISLLLGSGRAGGWLAKAGSLIALARTVMGLVARFRK